MSWIKVFILNLHDKHVPRLIQSYSPFLNKHLIDLYPSSHFALVHTKSYQGEIGIIKCYEFDSQGEMGCNH